MNRFISVFLLASCLITVVGCRRSSPASSAVGSPISTPVDLDFRAPVFDAQIDVRLNGERPLEDATLLVQLQSSRTHTDRAVFPSDFDGTTAIFHLKDLEHSERASLWVFQRTIGLAVFRIEEGQLNPGGAPLKLDIEELGNDEAARVVQFLDPQGAPESGLRVGVNRMYSNNPSKPAITVPDELWEVSREVTDQNGHATFRVATGARASSARIEGLRLGRQTMGLGRSEPAIVQLANTGIVRLRLDESVGRLDISRILMTSSNQSGVYGEWSMNDPKPGLHEVRMVEGELFLNSFLDEQEGVLVTRANRPLTVRAGEVLDIDITAIEGCKVFGRIVSKSGGTEEPIVGARLSIHPSDSLQRSHNMITNERGEFSTQLALGEFSLSQMVSVRETYLFMSEALFEGIVENGQQELDVGTLSLPTLYEVSGEVVNGDQNPLAFAEVVCMVGGKNMGGGRTDAKGRFKALTMSSGIEEFNVGPAEIYARIKADIETAQPLRLIVQVPKM